MTALLSFGILRVESAAAVCVPSGDAAAILNAIADSAESNSPVTIKLEQGNYYFGQVPIQEYDAASMQILGGYVPTDAHTCDENQRTLDASKTNLQLDGNNLPLRSPDDSITLEALSIGGQTTGGGVHLHSSKIELRYVRIANQTKYQDAVVIGRWGAASTDIKMTNVQFDHILDTSSDPNCGVKVFMGGTATAVLNHVTVDMRATVGMNSFSSDFCVDDGNLGGNKKIQLWNSILWDSSNSGGVLKASHSGGAAIKFYLYDVDFTGVSVSPTDTIQFDDVRYPSVQFDPFWTNPGAGDYSIGGGANSVAVNTGTVDAPEGEPHYDIAGSDRMIGSRPDMGAYESPYNDFAGANVFDVMNTNDVTDVNSPLYAGSLRAAMSKASAVNGPSLIQFFMPSCPSIITLNSLLPLVWGPLTLNGYSSPGSWANSDASGLFNANLCVAIMPAMTATTPNGIVVPSGAHDASLTVKGIGFGGFTNAIQLWGGYSHQIIGNQFGGVMNGIQLFGFDLSAIQIETNGSVIIGGPNPADRNVFQNANSTSADAAAIVEGVFADHTQPVCQIIGNLFGITPNGFSAVPNNKYGILLQGSGCLVQGNRIAGNIKDGIYILGGTNHVIQNNVIGPASFFGQDYSNPGAGIRIGAGAANNTIGAPSGFGGTYYQNVITDMDLGGILLGGDGDGNSIRGNFITGNGVLTGLNVDLGLDGPTSNDPGDADTGANDLQNFPVPHGFRWSSGTPAAGTFNIPAEIGASLETAPGHYQIDAYYDHACSPTGRGGGGWFGGAEIDVLSASPMAIQIPVVVPDYDSIHGRITLAATRIDPAGGSTSEFSACMPVDAIFSDAFEN